MLKLLLISVSAGLVACTITSVQSEPPADPLHNSYAPGCKLEGCCEGHGTVAYLQPDKFVMCTDGEPSQICDCH